jgi:hypothetical protein
MRGLKKKRPRNCLEVVRENNFQTAFDIANAILHFLSYFGNWSNILAMDSLEVAKIKYFF